MVGADEIVRFARMAFGYELPGPAASCLASNARRFELAPGMQAPLNTAISTLAYIEHGATKLVACASADREQIVAFHFGGDIISIPRNGQHAFILSALVKCDLIAFDADRFIDCVEAESRIIRTLLNRTQTALYRCRDKAVGLGRKTAQERLASFLMAMTERIGEVEKKHCRVDLPMSRRDIADSLGLTIETVSRQFTELRSAGLIETRGRGQVLIHDRFELANRAGHI